MAWKASKPPKHSATNERCSVRHRIGQKEKYVPVRGEDNTSRKHRTYGGGHLAQDAQGKPKGEIIS